MSYLRASIFRIAALVARPYSCRGTVRPDRWAPTAMVLLLATVLMLANITPASALIAGNIGQSTTAADDHGNSDAACVGRKVPLCHHEGGDHAHDSLVCENSVTAHLDHGDVLGVCPPRDDGDSDSDIDSNGDDDSDSDIGCENGAGGGCDDDGSHGCKAENVNGDGPTMFASSPCSADTDCDDGDVCNGVEICHAGCCRAGEPLECDDGQYCNGAERCQAVSGCVSGSPPCDDGVACTVDVCNESTRCCTHTSVDDRCNDGLQCNGAEACGGADGCYNTGPPVDCSALDSVCGVGICNETDGSCVIDAGNEGGGCDDGDDACTLSDRCEGGRCVGTPVCDVDCERCDAGVCSSLCGNPYDRTNDRLSVTDALFVLRASVDLEPCPLCICDVNADGVIGTTDALRLLWRVVKLPIDIMCPPPGSGSATTSTTTTTLLE